MVHWLVLCRILALKEGVGAWTVISKNMQTLWSHPILLNLTLHSEVGDTLWKQWQLKALDWNSVIKAPVFLYPHWVFWKSANWLLTWIGFPILSWYSWKIMCHVSSQVSTQGYKPASPWTKAHANPFDQSSIPPELYLFHGDGMGWRQYF